MKTPVKPRTRPRKKTMPDTVVSLRPRLREGARFHRLVEADLVLGGGLNVRLFDLLAAIDRVGSLIRGAQEAGLSYKGAWEMLERAQRLSPRPLLEMSRGGGEGGGSRLTETGRVLLTAFYRLQEENERFLDTLNREFGHDPVILQWLRRLFMKSSARNQWQGRVASVRMGAVTAEVEIILNGGATLYANVTNESVRTLGLEHGRDVIALVKAPMVMIITDAEGYKLSARNQMAGTISHLQKGPVTTEVTVSLPSGDAVVATVTSESAESLGLAEGKSATAIFKASAVILAAKG